MNTMAGKLDIVKRIPIDISIRPGGENVGGFIHIVKNNSDDSVKVVSFFETLKELGYEPSCSNSLKSLKDSKTVFKLLVTPSIDRSEYLISFKSSEELNQVRILYSTGIKDQPIQIINSEESVVKNYRVEPGCSIAVLSGIKKQQQKAEVA